MRPIFENILGAVGGTPLIRLGRIGRGLKATLLAKVEYTNPGGSVKDRVAVKMIEDAEKKGLIRPGGVIVEATAGNTGVGLAMVAAIKGYRCICVLPDKMSEDKISLLRAYGAEVVITPTSVPPDSPESYNGVADRLSREIPGAYRPNQFANPTNPDAHYLTTGPEIWEDTEGSVDVFVAGMGTGGTISGTARYLKEKKPGVVVVGADPEGSILSGDSPKPYKVEGIGEDFIPKTFDRQMVDEMIRVSDRDSFTMARRLAREEGLLVGGSAGTAAWAAMRYAQRLTEPRTIVVLLPDTGRNYLTRIFSDRWMQENGFWESSARKGATVRDVLKQKKELPSIVSVSPDQTLQAAIELFHRFNISQLPVMDGGRPVGSLQESTLLSLVVDGVTPDSQRVGAVMGAALPSIDMDADVGEAYRLLRGGANALFVIESGSPRAVVTRIDLVDFYTRKSA
jgi:cystathionine beta-synthase